MRYSLSAKLLLLLGSSQLVLSSSPDDQRVLSPAAELTRDDATANWGKAPVLEMKSKDAIAVALQKHADPVDALVSLQPELADTMAQPRLIHVSGEKMAEWMTEGDKLRLRRKGRKFRDITDYQELYADHVNGFAGKANLPKISHQRLIKPLFPKVNQTNMHDVLKHLTSYYNRYYGGVTGEESSVWLHDHVASIIAQSPFHTHISLEYFTHEFPQSSIIARFEPKVRDFSKPLTIIGAHQDSANYLFPLLPAPGADDDCSGTVSILEAFRVLATSGFVPQEGPVEFHWYAAEEGGLLGSQAVAAYKKKEGATIGAMMEFDMTAFVARNATESIGFIKTDADAPLTSWAVDLSEEYINITTSVYELMPGAGSDYMSYTKLGFPATFASEGNPVAGGFPGEFDPYVHTDKDTMDVDDETGVFSIDHMARFSELAIAFAIEQAGWDNKWR
ncbi:peptidase family M28 [Colletotrichum orchidophilum]|uniref:Peptide hydrolase n=1 Tax=Colletotrichum orchidophilum TaxID=1209926 RepID=A0A1G4B8D2_9PEZI|nr:peptidase family M28 [Colletotrichum orchidophilum]OHE97708.1 peptidase family M28 [Colletotrichum orchidophilum]